MSFWSHVATNPGRKFNFKLCWINDSQLTLPQIPQLTFRCCQSVQYFTLLHLTFLEIFNLWLTFEQNEARSKFLWCTTVKCINYHWKFIFKCCWLKATNILWKLPCHATFTVNYIAWGWRWRRCQSVIMLTLFHCSHSCLVLLWYGYQITLFSLCFSGIHFFKLSAMWVKNSNL